MSKTFVRIFVACILMTCFASSASAAVIEPDIEPTATYYRSAYAKIEILNGGTAAIKGSITGYPGTTTKTSVHLYLQKYRNGQWINVADWSNTNNASSCTLSKSKAVAKGKYRAKAVCSAYAGSKVEKITKYSNSINR